jgi:hypothetical protein
MKAKLTRLTDNGHTRTREIVGEAPLPPQVGQSFVMTAAPLDPTKDFRLVETSRVMYMTTVFDSPRKIKFTTENTDYEFEELDG